MAKVIAPLLSAQASGQFAHAMTFDKRGFVRKYVVPYNPQTTDQMTVRNILGDIQRELKALGATLRPQVKLALGYRWNSVIINDLMANNHAKWDALVTAYGAFSGPNKTAWAGADPGLGLVNPAGEAFYIVAKSFYDTCLRTGGDGLITEPIETTAVTNGGEWIA